MFSTVIIMCNYACVQTGEAFLKTSSCCPLAPRGVLTRSQFNHLDTCFIRLFSISLYQYDVHVGFYSPFCSSFKAETSSVVLAVIYRSSLVEYVGSYFLPVLNAGCHPMGFIVANIFIFGPKLPSPNVSQHQMQPLPFSAARELPVPRSRTMFYCDLVNLSPELTHT